MAYPLVEPSPPIVLMVCGFLVLPILLTLTILIVLGRFGWLGQ